MTDPEQALVLDRQDYLRSIADLKHNRGFKNLLSQLKPEFDKLLKELRFARTDDEVKTAAHRLTAFYEMYDFISTYPAAVDADMAQERGFDE